MKWIGVSGTWQLTSEKVEKDVRRAVEEILERGDGVITGGALGVDSFAMDEVVVEGLASSRIKVCLPVTFDIYKKHYLKRAGEGVITSEQANDLISLLGKIYKENPEAIIEGARFSVCDKESYYARNGTVVDLSDELYAFQVNGSSGTQDTMEKAKSEGKGVKVFSYEL